MKQRTYLEWIVYVVGGLYVALFLTTATMRLLYPYEVEWNEGAVLDHAVRVLNGKPIYTAPSLDFSAFVYTPLYYYTTALVMNIGGVGLWAGRIISIIATLLTSYLIARIIRRESSSRFLAISGAMLYIAFYHVTGFFYDIVRMDALAVFFVALSIYCALYVRLGFVFAAVLTALAYFTKQQMLFIVPAIAIGLYTRSKKEAIVFTSIAVLLLAIGTNAWNASTQGWYRFFTLTIPGAKAAAEFSWQTALEFFPKWIFGTFGLFTIIIIVGSILSRTARRRDSEVLLLSLYGFAMISTAISLGNPGGYANVCMPIAFAMAIVFPIAAHRIAGDRSPVLAPSMVLLEFLALVYNPLGEKMLFASARQRHAGDEFIAKLKSVSGDVWVPFHGYLNTLAGKPTHIHFMAMNDALFPHDTTSTRFRHEIDSSLAAHCFVAVILDEERVFGWDSIPHYHREQSIFQTTNVFLSRIGEASTRPQFIEVPE